MLRESDSFHPTKQNSVRLIVSANVDVSMLLRQKYYVRLYNEHQRTWQ